MFQTWDNSQLLRRVLWISAELTIVSSLKHKNTQPLYIFHRVRVLHLDRLKEGTWLHSFECRNFGAEEALDALMRCCLNITSAQKWHFAPFKFLQKRVSQLDKKITAYFWINFGVVICKKSCGKTFIDLFNECRRFLLSRQETFSAEIWKLTKRHFWANVMLRQPRVRAFRASLAQLLRA